MQIELLARLEWRTNLEFAVAMAEYIVHFYNCNRRHSSQIADFYVANVWLSAF